MMLSEKEAFRDFDTTHLPPVFSQITARTRELNFDIASEPLTGALLRTLAASKPGGRLLELGTGTGVATAWILAGMDAHSRLTTVDVSSEHQQVARELLGSDNRVTLLLEDALQFLKRQAAESYDFVFADAIPGKYDGLEDCLKIVRPGGFYIVDDMLPLPAWPKAHVQRVSLLLNQLKSDDRFVISPLRWASGVVVAVRR